MLASLYVRKNKNALLWGCQYFFLGIYRIRLIA
jgi:hypothetical protein